MRKRNIKIKFNNVNSQLQSPLFIKLPLDVRRHIYLQYWLDYGIVQHIYLFGPGSHLSHYPCLLNADAFNHHHPPLPEQSGSEADPATEGDEDDEDNNQPEPDDDPGDINGAIAQIVANPPSQIQPTDAANADVESDTNRWKASPWCMHEKCFRAYMEMYDMSFERAYSRNYQGLNHAARPTVGLIRPFFLCKKMYMEAGESMYSVVRFSFASMAVLDRMIKEVPKYLSRRMQVVNLIGTVPIARLHPSLIGTASRTREPNMSCLSDLCQTLPDLLPNVRELCLTLHINAHQRKQKGRRALPDKDWFEPLYNLAGQLTNLSSFNIKLVSRCEQKKGPLAYGGTPKYLANAPFKAVLVPMGWHAGTDCVDFWLD